MFYQGLCLYNDIRRKVILKFCLFFLKDVQVSLQCMYLDFQILSANVYMLQVEMVFRDSQTTWL